MHRADSHTTPGPLDAYFHEMEARIIEGVASHLEQAQPPSIDLSKMGAQLGLDPLRAYTAKEVAQMLGTDRVASVYEIPDDELPRVRRIGASVGFLGINVLCYMHRLPPVDVARAIDEYRSRLMQDRPTVRPIRAGGPTRIL